MPFFAAKTFEARGNDAYYTPEHAIDALLDRESFPGLVLEPACGNGAISKRFKNCTAFDLDTGINFLGNQFWDVDHVVTNPPYRHAQQFVEKSLFCAKGKVAMLLKLAFLEGQRRKKFLEHSPLETVYVFSARLDFFKVGDTVKDSGGTMAFAWFVWNNLTKPRHPIIKWI